MRNPVTDSRHAAKARLAAGFTLVELLIVIMILGILAGIAIFAADGFQDDATVAYEDSNARIDAAVRVARGVNPSGAYSSSGSC